MSEETKQTLGIALEFLRRTCVEQGISIAVNKENGDLNFFDTEMYVQKGKFSGIKIPIKELFK